MLASVLKASGKNVGLYTSPHLIKFNERIRVNGNCILDEEIASFIDKNKKHIERINSTFFETTTVMAFDYFVHKKIDIAIIEVGLGGRLDSTNVVNPLLTAITPVSLDHQHILGYSLKSIANEKAGIIKEGVPVVVSKQKYEAERVIRKVAAKIDAKIIRTDKTKYVSIQEFGTKFSYKSKEYFTPLMGVHQSENAAMAIEIANAYDKKIDKETIQEGFSKTKWPGRMQKLSKNLPIYYDVAHNLDGIKSAICSALLIQEKKPHILLSLKGDKEIDLIANEIFKYNKSLIVSGIENLELMSANELHSLLNNIQSRTKLEKIDDFEDALDELTKRVKKTNTLGLVLGSHYIAKPVFDKFGILM